LARGSAASKAFAPSEGAAGLAAHHSRRPRESLARISIVFVKKRRFGTPVSVLGGKIPMPVDCREPANVATVFDSGGERFDLHDEARAFCGRRVTD
jgi:hypothetical protein